ncbi:unnamed protein product [Caenorhabditis angaria]|uniref:NPHP4 Ig-like domain-containing protein n=1 Tax=Caenorhabditis angaria TaxID=860376 RepID=A0A9P1ISW5_9PELO|nr:unnamed protein product [Caenorhabditis angaria]
MQSDAENPKIVFRNRTAENFEPIAILDLHVHRKPPIFHENLVMYAEEARNCTRRVSASSNFAAGRIAAVRCSDPAVKLSIAAKNSIEFTAFCNDTPQKREFLIFAYTDCWQMKLAQVWRVTVVAMRRIDLRTVAGQMTKYRLSVKRRRPTWQNIDVFFDRKWLANTNLWSEYTVPANF